MIETPPPHPDKKPVRVRPVPAVTRSIAILRLLGQQRQGMGVKTIADALGLVPSTCLHILRVLVDENLVRQETGSKRYTLASGMVSLARSVLGAQGFAHIVQPALESIAAGRGITVMGAELTPRRTILVLAVARPTQPLQLHADVGSEFPCLTSATGRLVAAFGPFDPQELREGFARIEWDRPMSVEEWLAEVEEARLRGWAVDRDRFKNGITAYAVPILTPGGAFAHSIVAMGLSAEMASLDGDLLVRDMQRAAAAISGELSAL